VSRGYTSGKFAALWREGILQTVDQKLFQGGFVRSLMQFGAGQQAGLFGALNSGVNFGDTQEKLFCNLSIRGPLVSIFKELYENNHVLGL
jgi:hypothetical protein